MNRRNTWISIPLSLIATIAVLTCLHAVEKQKEEEQPYGRFTREDIINRTRGLQALSLLPSSATQSAYKQDGYSHQVKVKRFWCIDCSDESGMLKGHVQ